MFIVVQHRTHVVVEALFVLERRFASQLVDSHFAEVQVAGETVDIAVEAERACVADPPLGEDLLEQVVAVEVFGWVRFCEDLRVHVLVFGAQRAVVVEVFALFYHLHFIRKPVLLQGLFDFDFAVCEHVLLVLRMALDRVHAFAVLLRLVEAVVLFRLLHTLVGTGVFGYNVDFVVFYVRLVLRLLVFVFEGIRVRLLLLAFAFQLGELHLVALGALVVVVHVVFDDPVSALLCVPKPRVGFVRGHHRLLTGSAQRTVGVVQTHCRHFTRRVLAECLLAPEVTPPLVLLVFPFLQGHFRRSAFFLEPLFAQFFEQPDALFVDQHFLGVYFREQLSVAHHDQAVHEVFV